MEDRQAACPTTQVATWMAAADLVALPSYNEGCPNVVIEALSAGRPVVATHVGGVPELMDDTCGRLVAPMDTPALVQALDEVLTATVLVEQAGAKARIEAMADAELASALECLAAAEMPEDVRAEFAAIAEFITARQW